MDSRSRMVGFCRLYSPSAWRWRASQLGFFWPVYRERRSYFLASPFSPSERESPLYPVGSQTCSSIERPPALARRCSSQFLLQLLPTILSAIGQRQLAQSTSPSGLELLLGPL